MVLGHLKFLFQNATTELNAHEVLSVPTTCVSPVEAADSHIFITDLVFNTSRRQVHHECFLTLSAVALFPSVCSFLLPADTSHSLHVLHSCPFLFADSHLLNTPNGSLSLSIEQM